MKRSAIFAVACLWTGVANAGLITQTQSFDLSAGLTNGSAGAAQPLIFETFDPGQGALTSVEISIAVQLVVLGTLPPLTTATSGGPIPQAYPFNITIDVGFGGLAFLNAPTLIYSGTAPGVPIPFASVTSMDYAAVLTEMTDLVGLAAIVDGTVAGPPLGVGGRAYIPPGFVLNDRGDFVSPVPGFATPLIIMPDFSSTAILAGGLTGSIRFEGDISIDYLFEDLPVTAVPEPATSGLLAAGLLVFGLFGWHGRRPRKQAAG